jgi:hypothetical protein
MSALNIGEKIAATYLRLNGFLLLPHFTVFIDGYPRHIDLLGLRAADSEERPFGKRPCLLDGQFYEKIKCDFKIANPMSVFLGAIVEVRTNEKTMYPKADYCDYVGKFLGKAQQISIAFARTDNFVFKENTLVVNLDYALKWIFERIAHMENELDVNKTEGWFQSDAFLADILILRKLGLQMASQQHSKTFRVI